MFHFFLVGFVVSFSVGLSLVVFLFLFYFLLSLFGSFQVSVLMWVIVSRRSSRSTGPNLLHNGIGSFISVFGLVWIFSFLCLGDFS